MIRLSTQDIKYLSFAIVLLFIISTVMPAFIILPQSSLLNKEENLEKTDESHNGLKDMSVIEGTQHNSLLENTRAKVRSIDFETEPNDDISSAVTNGNQLKNGNELRGEMRHNTDELDISYIDLTGGGKNSIDRLNITPVFTDPDHVDNKSVGIELKMYTVFEGELFLLEYKILGSEHAVKTDLLTPWVNATSLFVNADRTGRYYLKVMAVYIRDPGTNEVIHPDAYINYSLIVSITGFTGTDKNNDMNNGTALNAPITAERIKQGEDHWDWYTISSLTPNRANNISIRIKITDAYISGYKDSYLHYVKVACVFKYYDLAKEKDFELICYGDWKGLFNPSTIQIYANATFTTAYLGIHSQQYKRVDNNDVDVIDCGASSVKFNINTVDLKLVNTKPKLLQESLIPTTGNLRDDYEFKIIYQDDDNDEPWFVNVAIEGIEYNLSISTDETNDGDFSDGELYELTLSGSEFKSIPHEKYETLTYSFKTYDYYEELNMQLDFFETETYTDFKIIDNVRPTLRSSLPEAWSIKEDSKPVYIKLFSIFNDPDRKKYTDEVKFQVWSYAYDWDKIMATDNLTISIMENNTLKIEPKLNKFGTDIIQIRAYDNEGAGTAVHYDMKIIIDPVNDKPILTQPPDFIGDISKAEDEYCNITFLADDSADGNTDLILYSTDIFDKIPELAKDPNKYKYQFSNYTGVLSFIPVNEMVGEYNISVTATDTGIIAPVGQKDIKSFKLNIENRNDAPVAIINSPEDNAKFNTSANIPLNGKDSTDDDIIYGDRLNYGWFLLLNGTDEEFLGSSNRPNTTVQIKKAGYHTLKLRVRDSEGAIGTTTINIRIISLVGDIPGGDDTDDDGIPDLWELRYDMDPEKFDSDEDLDNDSYSNLKEYLGEDRQPGGDDSSNPRDPKSYPGDLDADSLPDFWERQMFNTLLQSPTADPDDDGYTNLQEYLGLDGEPGNNDWADPLNMSSIPVPKKSEKPDDDVDLGMVLIIASVVVVIIILLLVYFLFIMTRKKKDKDKDKEKKEEEKKGDEKKPFYTPEQPQPVPMMPPASSGTMTPMQMPMGTAPAPAPPPGPMQFAQPMGMPMQMQMPMTQPPMPAPTPQTQTPKPSQTKPQMTTLGLPAAGKVIEVDDRDIEKK